MRPTHDWPINQKLFTLDVMYLHDKSGPDNCTHDVYDSLVDAIERVSEYEGYIFEGSHGLSQSVFRRMSTLLSHPPQRCAQVDLPKPPAKKVTAVKKCLYDFSLLLLMQTFFDFVSASCFL